MPSTFTPDGDHPTARGRRARSPRAVPALLALAAAVAAGGVAYAAIPDAGGVIHGCYSPNGAAATNGTPLNIIDSDSGSCSKNQQAVQWSQTGPPGAAGADGISVTSVALSPGDANCPAGGSEFTAAGGTVTHACNGLKGDKGDKGDPGPAGVSGAYANYGGTTFASIGDGLTVTVASVTVPAGSYVLSGAVHAVDVDDLEFLQCSFVAASPVNGRFAVLTGDGSEPILGDVTTGFATNSVFLRCKAQGGTIRATGQMIATRVGAVTASE